MTGLTQWRTYTPASLRSLCYLPFILFFVFSLAERKNEKQLEGKVPLRMITFEPPRESSQ